MKFISIIAVLSTLTLAFTVYADPVNINAADATDLADNLKGIGSKKADAIVKFRDDNGKFNTIDELEQVKGIGSKTIEKNRDDILLSAAKKK